MQLWLAAGPSFFHGIGQGSRQLVELLVAFLPGNHLCAPHREANAPGGNTPASTTA